MQLEQRERIVIVNHSQIFFRESEAAADVVVGGSKKKLGKKVFHGSAISFKIIFDKRKLTKLKIRTLKFLPLEI